MNEQAPVDVGARIRELRQERRLSLRAMAERSGLSLNAISRIERGESSPTVASLFLIANALKVHIADLFTVAPESATIIVRRNQRLRSHGAGLMMESLGIGLPGQILEPFLMTIEAGAEIIDIPCSHPGEEFVHCIEGEIEYQVDDVWYRLETGDSLLFQARQPHCYRNTGLQTARVLLILASTEQDVSLSQKQHLMTIQGNSTEDGTGHSS